MTRVISLVSMCAMLIFVDGGCRRGPRSVKVDADFDPAEARAEADRPSSTVVEDISIPQDPALPKWVVVVEPFQVAASGVTSGTGWHGDGSPPTLPITNPGEQIGPGVAAQLVSALQRVGNVVVVDYAVYERDPEKIAAGLKDGEQGPFIIKGTVTEFSETAELESEGESSQGSKAGQIMSHIPVGPVSLAGHLINAAKGRKSITETRRIGMVGLDVQIVDPATGRLLASFLAEGSFTASGQTKTRTKWGKTKTHTNYASSAIGQAQRVALNNAIQNIYEILSQTPSAP